jgi:hypothetical protein
MKRDNFYRRSPGDALAGMVGMTLEERGVYNTIIDLLYLTWRPLEDSRAYIAGHCGCAVQKLNPLITSLIAKKKLVRFDEGGVWYLSNPRFEDERNDVKGPAKTRSGRGEVGEKSASVGRNPPTCLNEDEGKQPVTALEKRREEKKTPIVPKGDGQLELVPVEETKPPDEFEALWKAYPHSKGRSSKVDSRKVWAKLDPHTKAALPAGAARYGREGREPKMDCGAPALERWLRRGLFADWIAAAPEPAAPADQSAVWRRRVEAYLTGSRYWNTNDWGGKPGHDGCSAPAAVLAEFGFGGAEIVPFPFEERAA